MLDNKIIDSNDHQQLELYIHIPFCARKCNYCDFLSFPMKETEHGPYIDQLCAEIRESAALATNYEISTIFIGGGTPSLLDPKYISRIMYYIRRFYTVRAPKSPSSVTRPRPSRINLRPTATPASTVCPSVSSPPTTTSSAPSAVSTSSRTS